MGRHITLEGVGEAYLGGPAIKTALPAIFPCLTISSIIAAAFRAFSCPTRPCDAALGSKVSVSTPRPRMCECAAIRFIPRSSLLWGTVWIVCGLSEAKLDHDEWIQSLR